MIRIGIAQWCLDRSGMGALYQASDLGFCAMHVDAGGQERDAPFLTELAVQRDYLQAVQDTGVEITAIAVNSLNSLGLTSPANSMGARECWDAIQGAIDAAAAMEIGLVFLPSFDNGEIRSEYDLMRTAEILRAACLYAQNSRVLLATENTLDAVRNLKLLAEVNHPNLRILVDSLNPVLWEHDTSTLIRELFPYMCDQLHAKDGLIGSEENVVLNTGHARFSETIHTLQALQFTGYFIVENEYTHNREVNLILDKMAIINLFEKAH